MTTEEGTFVDDLLVSRTGEKRFLLVVNASNVDKDFAWMDARRPKQAVLRNVSDDYALLALQGPQSAAILKPLTDVDLDIKPGEVIALVGPSGAGKSTILSLLYRFYDVDSGRITLDGVDVRELPLRELRRALAMVAQEPVLFSGTIRDNIAYGRDGATLTEIETAARDAYAHDFIVGFPDAS